METVTARGASGTTYNYAISLMNAPWNDVPANYMFASKGLGGWHVVYVGECTSAKTRMGSHERWEEATRLGATHVLNHVAAPNEVDRLREERDLIQALQPKLNVHHQPTNSMVGLSSLLSRAR